MNVNYLWNFGTEKEWHDALAYYSSLVDVKHLGIEEELAHLDYKVVEKMNAQEFYDFLYNKYFFWKYTAPNRLATTRSNLVKYQTNGEIDKLGFIHDKIFKCDLNDSRKCLETVTKIRGLGFSGASGLLSLMYPHLFGTVDQFAVYALMKIDGLPEHDLLSVVKPEGLKAKDCVMIIDIYRRKAKDLNKKFNTDFWTPRKIDQILWCIDR